MAQADAVLDSLGLELDALNAATITAEEGVEIVGDLRAENERLRAALDGLADWVEQYRQECEAPAGARDPLLRATIRQAMFDAAALRGEPVPGDTGLRCENCGKPMAEHGPMANCYPAGDTGAEK